MIEWLRYIPHPTYGNYGGARKKCVGPECPLPIDALDELFRQHDVCLRKCVDKEQRQACDKNLNKELKKNKTKGKYAWFYRACCIAIF